LHIALRVSVPVLAAALLGASALRMPGGVIWTLIGLCLLAATGNLALWFRRKQA
jgi:hypothetical protein